MRRVIALLLLAVLALAGCTVAPKAEVKVSTGTVRVLVLGGAGLEGTLFETFTAAYPDIKPESVPMPEGDFASVVDQIKTGKVKVDAIVAPANNFLFGQSVIAPLDDLVKKEKISLDDYGTALNFGRYQDKLYGLPVIMSPMVVVYNKAMFDQAGLKQPTPDWTWADFEAAAVALGKLKAGKENQWGLAIPPWVMVDMLLTAGQGPTAPDLAPLQASMAMLNRLHGGEKSLANVALGSTELEYFKAFAKQEVGMLLTYWETSFGHSRPDIEYGLAPIPGGKTPAAATVAMLTANAENKAQAEAFVKVIGGPMGSQAVGRMPGSPVPGNTSEPIVQMWAAHALLKDEAAFMMDLSYVAPTEYPEALAPLLLTEADAAIRGLKKPEEAIAAYQQARAPHMSKK